MNSDLNILEGTTYNSWNTKFGFKYYPELIWYHVIMQLLTG